MTFKHRVQIALRLNTLTNIKIRQSVFLQLRVTIYKKNSQQNGKNEVAIPFSIITDLSSFQEGNISEINNEGTSYMSKRMLVRYADQKIIINEICLFRAQIITQTIQQVNKTKFYVYCELLSFFNNEAELIDEWKSQTLYTLVNTSLPIFFPTYRFVCALDTCIHSVIVSTEYVEKEKLKTLEQYIKVNKNKNLKLPGIYDDIIYPLNLSYEKIRKELILLKQCIPEIPQNEEQINKLTLLLDNTITQCKYSYLKKEHQDELKNLKVQDGQKYLKEKFWKLDLSQYVKAVEHDLLQYSEIIYQFWHAFLFCRAKNCTYLKTLLFEFSKKLENTYCKTNVHLGEQKKAIEVNTKSNIQLDLFCLETPTFQLQENVFNTLIKNKIKNPKYTRIVVFVHGYQASSFDMEILCNYLKYKDPALQTMISSINEGRTDQPIEQSGHRLALEIKNYINSRELKQFQLSIVSHSMGGIISRAALKYLQLYREKFNTFVSLGSPHLGYIYHSSALVKASMWVLNQVKKDPSMIQLTMQDNEQLKKTYLYELSMRQELKWFKNIIVIGSKEDQYVPFWSAMLHDKDFFFETQSSRTYKTLLNNLTQHTNKNILRIQLIYNEKIKDLSAFIGRTAHIKALNHLPTIDILAYLLKNVL